MVRTADIEKESKRALDGLESCCGLLERLSGLLAPIARHDKNTAAPLGSAVQRLDAVVAKLRASLPDAKPTRTAQAVPAPPRGLPGRCVLRGQSPGIPIPTVLEFLSGHHRSGTLRVGARDETFTLGVTEGRVTHAVSDSPPPDERIGSILVRHGTLEAEQLDEFLIQSANSGRSTGEALVAAGVVSSAELVRALEEQVQNLFHRMFAHEQATFYFYEGAPDQPDIHIAMNVMQLLLESARTSDEQSRA